MRPFRLALLSVFLLAFGPQLRATAALPPTGIQAYEDSLVRTADSMYNAFIPDMRLNYALQFIRQLKGALALPGSYDYPFDSLSKVINILPSGDGRFRIFNWVVAPSEVARRYYGAIQTGGEGGRLWGLVDYSGELTKGAEDSVLTGGRWYGVLYYRIMRIEGSPDSEPAYTVFGVNASSPVSTKKVLDVLTLTPRGPRFGAPIFGIRSQATRDRVKRFILEYRKDAQASLNWDDRVGGIFFDRLFSPSGDDARKYTLVPSGQYDGFRWRSGEWVFVKDIVPITILQDGEQPTGGPE